MAYGRHPFASDMFTKMNRYRSTGEFCDVTLVVGENPTEEIKAHRLVLSSFSQYFENLLKPNMQEGHQDRIEIHDLSGPVVKKLINFAYVGILKINTKNVESIFEGANFLAIDSACTLCCNFMTSRMDRSNCIGVLRCAELYSQKYMRNAALKMIFEHFTHVVKDAEFYDLPTGTIQEIISSANLVLRGFRSDEKEKLILDTVVKYVQKNHLEESADAVSLFKHVRLPLLEKSVLSDLEISELVSKNQTLKELVQSRSKVPAGGATDKHEAWMQPRRHNGLCHMMTKHYGTKCSYDTREVFSDREQGRDSYIKGMKVYVCNWDGKQYIGGMEVVYGSGRRTVHGAPMEDSEVHEFIMADNERIVDVTLRSAKYINQLEFITSEKRTIGPFGGKHGAKSEIRKPAAGTNGFLAFIEGEITNQGAGSLLHGLRLHFAYDGPPGHSEGGDDYDYENDSLYDEDSDYVLEEERLVYQSDVLTDECSNSDAFDNFDSESSSDEEEEGY